MFPMAAALMHHGLERAAAPIRRSRRRPAGDERWSFRRARRAEQRASPATCAAAGRRARRPGGGDDGRTAPSSWWPSTRISKLGAAAVLLSPAWKAVEVGHALGADRPGPRRGRRRRRRPCWPSASGAEAVTDLDDPPTDGAIDRTAAPARRRPARCSRPTRRSWSSARARPACPRRSATPTARWAWPPRTGAPALGLGPDDRFQVATPPSHILGLLNLLAAATAGATVRLHRRFDLDEVLRRIEAERMTLEMAVAPIALAMANHPDLEDYDLSSLRYIMWGATPVTESVAERGHRAHRRALAAGLRRQRAAGDRRQPGRRPERVAARLRRAAARRASSCGWPTSTPGRSCRPGRSARSRSAARR